MKIGLAVDWIWYGNEWDLQEGDLQLRLQLVVYVLILQYRYMGFCQYLHNLIDLATEQEQILNELYRTKAIDQI